MTVFQTVETNWLAELGLTSLNLAAPATFILVLSISVSVLCLVTALRYRVGINLSRELEDLKRDGLNGDSNKRAHKALRRLHIFVEEQERAHALAVLKAVAWPTGDHPVYAWHVRSDALMRLRLLAESKSFLTIDLLTWCRDGYRQLVADSDRVTQMRDWTSARYDLGATLVDLAKQQGDADQASTLQDAINTFREAIASCPASVKPSDRCWYYHALGEATSLLGLHLNGEAAIDIGRQAVATDRQALDIYAWKPLPEALVLVFLFIPGLSTAVLRGYIASIILRAELGVALAILAGRLDGPEALAVFEEAEAIYRSLLTPLARITYKGWTEAQFRFGVTLAFHGDRLNGADALVIYREAEAVLKRALQAVPRALAQARADIQSRLGRVLLDIADLLNGQEAVAKLREAEAALRTSFPVLDCGNSRKSCSKNRYALSLVLLRLARGAGNKDALVKLAEAEDLARSQLTIFDRAAQPRSWAYTWAHLGVVLTAMAGRLNGEVALAKLREAEAAFRAALEALSIELYPQPYAAITKDLDGVLALIRECENSSQSS